MGDFNIDLLKTDIYDVPIHEYVDYIYSFQVQVQFIWFHLITFYNKNRKNNKVKSEMWMPPKRQSVRLMAPSNVT